jgi:hypothetical protein
LPYNISKSQGAEVILSALMFLDLPGFASLKVRQTFNQTRQV